MSSMRSRFQSRFRIARAAGLLMLLALLLVAAFGRSPAQNWAAGVAVVALLVMRAAWRCPACSMPLPVIPDAKLTACKHCQESFVAE